MERLLVVSHELVLVLALQLLVRDVEVQSDLLIALELHDEEGVSGLALAERRIQPNTEHKVHVVGLREDNKLFDVVVLDLVVVRLAAQAERGIVHVDVEATSAMASASKIPDQPVRGTNLGVR